MQKKKNYNNNNILLRELSKLETWSAKNVMGNIGNFIDLETEKAKIIYLKKKKKNFSSKSRSG